MYGGFESKFDESFAKWKAPDTKSEKNPFTASEEGELLIKLRQLAENLPKLRSGFMRDPENENFRIAIQKAERERAQITEELERRRRAA